MMKRIQSNCDRISNLPEDLIEKILTFVTLKDAGKTCVLSRKWRNVWTRVPDLVFDKDFAEVEADITNPKDRDLATFFYMSRINQILLAHEGPISKFSLQIPGLEGTHQIDCLLVYLSKKRSVHDLTLHCMHYKPHSCVFACFSELIRLDLCCNLFKVPASFGGFSRLTYLKLASMELAADSLANFLPKCPLLEYLSLVYTKGCEHIKIFGPCLKTFILCGRFKSICFKYAPLISVLTIEAPDLELVQGMASNMIQALGSLPQLQMLELGRELLQIFVAGSIAGRLPSTSLDNLKHLKISSLCFNVTNDVTGLFCLIRSLPKLQKIFIYMVCTHSHRKRICPTLLEV